MKPYAHYDTETDSLGIFLSETKSVEAEEVADDVIVSFGPSNEIVGIEFIGQVRELFKELLASERPPAVGIARDTAQD